MEKCLIAASDEKDLHLSLLGNVEIRVADQQLNIGHTKVQGLLDMLAMSSGLPQQRDFLADLFWPEMSRETGRQNLRRALYNLKSALGEASHLLSSSKHSVTLIKSGLWLDVAELREYETLSDQIHSPAVFNGLAEKIKLYRTEFMAGVSLPDCPYFEDWLQLHRESLNQLILKLLEQLSNYFEHRGDHGKALEFALIHTQHDPSNEDMQCKVMRLYAFNGQNDAAIKQYESTCRLLKNELDVEPREETRQLATRIRNGNLLDYRSGKGFDGLISELYRSIDQPEQWLDVTRKIAASVGAEKFLFASRDKVTLEMKGQFHWALGDDALESYMSYYSGIDELSQRLECAPKNRFHTSEDLYPEKQLFASEIYNDFCKPFGIRRSIGVTFDDPDSTLYSQFACLWEAGTTQINSSELQALNTLVPHLQQFVRLRQKFEHLQMQSRSTEQVVERFSMPAFLCDLNGKILCRNAQADSLLSTSKILTALAETIVFYQHHHKTEFSVLIHQAINAVDAKENFTNGSWCIKDDSNLLEFSIYPFTFRPEGLVDCSQPCALVVISGSRKIN